MAGYCQKEKETVDGPSVSFSRGREIHPFAGTLVPISPNHHSQGSKMVVTIFKNRWSYSLCNCMVCVVLGYPNVTNATSWKLSNFASWSTDHFYGDCPQGVLNLPSLVKRNPCTGDPSSQLVGTGRRTASQSSVLSSPYSDRNSCSEELPSSTPSEAEKGREEYTEQDNLPWRLKNVYFGLVFQAIIKINKRLRVHLTAATASALAKGRGKQICIKLKGNLEKQKAQVVGTSRVERMPLI